MIKTSSCESENCSNKFSPAIKFQSDSVVEVEALMSTLLRILAPDSKVYSEKSKAKMSTESIVSARSLRQSLARDKTEKETSIDQSPDLRAGIKMKAPPGVQKKMQKERRGNSQSNDHKNYKNIKIQKKNNSTPHGGKKTKWNAESNTARSRRRRMRGKRKKRDIKKKVKRRRREKQRLYHRIFHFSDMETPEGKAEKAVYRCEVGGYTAN